MVVVLLICRLTKLVLVAVRAIVRKQTTRMLTLKEDLLRQALNHATVFSKVLLLHGESQKVILHQ